MKFSVPCGHTPRATDELGVNALKNVRPTQKSYTGWPVAL
jgi:hypothetical protein